MITQPKQVKEAFETLHRFAEKTKRLILKKLIEEEGFNEEKTISITLQANAPIKGDWFLWVKYKERIYSTYHPNINTAYLTILDWLKEQRLSENKSI